MTAFNITMLKYSGDEIFYYNDKVGCDPLLRYQESRGMYWFDRTVVVTILIDEEADLR